MHFVANVTEKEHLVSSQGLLMKIDAFHYIQPGTVYRYHYRCVPTYFTWPLFCFKWCLMLWLFVLCFLRGFHAVSDEEVCELYSGTFHVPLQQHSGFYGKVSGLSVMLGHVWCGTDGMCCPVSHNPLCTDGYCLGLNLEMSSAQMFQMSDSAYPYCYINPDLVIGCSTESAIGKRSSP